MTRPVRRGQDRVVPPVRPFDHVGVTVADTRVVAHVCGPEGVVVSLTQRTGCAC